MRGKGKGGGWEGREDEGREGKGMEEERENGRDGTGHGMWKGKEEGE